MKNLLKPLLFSCLTAAALLSCTSKPANTVAQSSATLKTDTAKVITPAIIQNSPPETTEEIKRAYQETDALLGKNQLDSTTFEYNCNNEKSGTVTFYTDHDQLRLIKHNYSEYDHFSSSDSFFITGDKLFFVYKKSIVWSFESGPEGSTKDDVTESRSYFINEKPMKCLEKKYTIHSQSPDKPQPDQLSSKEVSCKESPALLTQYKLLLSHQNKPNKGCLDQQSK